MKTIKKIEKVAIIGVGIMGGSLALSLKKLYPHITIWGYARNQTSYAKLKRLRILDEVEKDLAKMIEGADLIILGLPVYLIIDYCAKIRPFLKKGAIVFDLGSTKEVIEKNARRLLGAKAEFVGCHPLAGSEKSGAQFAKAGLYQGCLCLITSSAAKPATKFVKSIWEAMGAKVIFLSSATHDKILSCVSHLPHIISFSITRFIPKEYLKFIPPSLKDLTRISNSPANVWADILLSNKNNINVDIRAFIKILRELQNALKTADHSEVMRLITEANVRHKNFF
ncbi:MAG: prephenate dehydrogenase [Candidatus Omnitrophica bacterium]|nr:prephenate dehydrogenase [Candidatus Omnitrophota bacterium]